jgi:NAD(P)H-dependent FMN reductase
MHLLALSGSLRAGSLNTALLEAASVLAPRGVTITLFERLAELPHFNPDLDLSDREPPAAVADLRRAVGTADGVLLSTPEYARGLPGSFKNALDWLVGSTEFPGKHVAVLSPSERAVHARAQLSVILTTMSARLIERPTLVIPLPSREMNAGDIVRDLETSEALTAALSEIIEAIRRDGAASPISRDAPTGAA